MRTELLTCGEFKI